MLRSKCGLLLITLAARWGGACGPYRRGAKGFGGVPGCGCGRLLHTMATR